MPILEPARLDSPLTQGDVLRDVPLFTTRMMVDARTAQSVQLKFDLCMVVSRPCVAAHKDSVIVAGIKRYTDPVPRNMDGFDKVLGFLTDTRDAGSSPDVFYLGQLPGHTGRYCARLDSLHTIEIPEDDTQRKQFLAERRAFTLHPDFARDLHLRVFNAFARLGFDDHRWPSLEDLQWLVNQGKADITAAELAVRQLEAQKASREAEGTQFKEADLTAAQEKLQNLRDRVAPFERELWTRQSS